MDSHPLISDSNLFLGSFFTGDEPSNYQSELDNLEMPTPYDLALGYLSDKVQDTTEALLDLLLNYTHTKPDAEILCELLKQLSLFTQSADSFTPLNN